MSQLRLLWAATHPTLGLSDIPALRRAGFKVLPEAPELSVIDALGRSELTPNRAVSREEQSLENLRLWPRL